jgi:hypothetical protein
MRFPESYSPCFSNIPERQPNYRHRFLALGVETNIFLKKKEFSNVPVLRNLVPAQVLAGKSSFNSGKSISAGLPFYARNQVKAIAGILDRS